MNIEFSDSRFPAMPPDPPAWEQRILELREEEWQAHKDCLAAAREALVRYKAGPHRAVSIRDIAKLLELASKLGRLATGADSVGAISSYEDPRLVAELQKQLQEVFNEPIDIDSERIPGPSIDNTTRN